MPGKMARSAPRPAFRLPEVLVAVSTPRLSCKRAGKTRTLMPVGDTSGESRPDKRLRENADTKWHDNPEVLPSHQPGGAAVALPAAARRSGAALEDQRKQLLRTRALAEIRGCLRGCHAADEHQACALLHHPVESQVVPQPRGIADHRRYHGRDGPQVAADSRRHRGHSPQIPRSKTRAGWQQASDEGIR